MGAPASNGRRDQIVRHAAALFDRHGYHQTTMIDVANDVGIKKPTLYHYVASKEEILFLIHEEFVDLLIAAQQARAALTDSPDELLLGTMVDILRLMETHHSYVRVFFEHHRELPPGALRDAITAKRDTYFDDVREMIARGAEAGVFIVPDPRLAALAMFGMCNWAYTWYRPDGPHRPDDIARWFWGWLVTGLRGVRPELADVLLREDPTPGPSA